MVICVNGDINLLGQSFGSRSRNRTPPLSFFDGFSKRLI